MSAKLKVENYKLTITKLLRNQGVLIGLVLIIIAASILERSFFTATNILNILRQSSALGIVCLGVTFVMMTGGMDLSVGSTISLCAVVSVSVMNHYGHGNITNIASLFAILVAVIIGFIVGTINGSLIVSFNGRLGETFIITYGMQIVLAAIALLYSGGHFLTGTFDHGIYDWFSSGVIPIAIFLALAFILHILLAYTPIGKQVSFIGANMDCARMSGIRVNSIRVLVYGMCGISAGLASVIITSRVYSASPLQGSGYELDAIAAVMVGGTSQTGGKGGIINTVLGVLVLSVLGNALNVIGVDANAQLLFRGAIILIAVGLDVLNRNLNLKEASK
jgi:ribose/xylose/arabinose/galactoside ABC-type transport system permease subunit